MGTNSWWNGLLGIVGTQPSVPPSNPLLPSTLTPGSVPTYITSTSSSIYQGYLNKSFLGNDLLAFKTKTKDAPMWGGDIVPGYHRKWSWAAALAYDHPRT